MFIQRWCFLEFWFCCEREVGRLSFLSSELLPLPSMPFYYLLTGEVPGQCVVGTAKRKKAGMHVQPHL